MRTTRFQIPGNFIGYLVPFLFCFATYSCQKEIVEQVPRKIVLEAGVEESAFKYELLDLEHNRSQGPYFIDIDEDGEDDFKFFGAYETDVNHMGSDLSTYVLEPLREDAQAVRKPVPFGTTIDDSLAWENGAFHMQHNTLIVLGYSSCGYWEVGEIGYLALRVKNEDRTAYAWVKMSASFSSADFIDCGRSMGKPEEKVLPMEW